MISVSRYNCKVSQQPNGFVTLISIVILSVVSVSIVITILMTGITSGKIAGGVESSLFARSYANACAEQALGAIRTEGTGGLTAFSNSIDFTPDGSPAGSCSYDVTDAGGENRTIEVTGTTDNSTRRISITVSDIDPIVTISSWEETGAF